MKYRNISTCVPKYVLNVLNSDVIKIVILKYPKFGDNVTLLFTTALIF